MKSTMEYYATFCIECVDMLRSYIFSIGVTIMLTMVVSNAR